MSLKGAFSAYNAVNDQHFRASSQCRHKNLNPQLLRRHNGVVCTSSFPRRGKVVAVATGEPRTKEQQQQLLPSLADRLRLGGLAENGVYKEKFIVRSYEVGGNKTATIQTIANYLQEVSCTHIQSLGFSTDGFSTTYTMRKLHLIWVIGRMHIEIDKYPAWSDVVEIETWAQFEGRVGIRRDWILKDYATGEAIGRATSKWFMVNQETRRLQKVADEVRDECEQYCAPGIRLAFPEENSKSLKKIAKLDDPAQYSKLGLAPRLVDLDMNQHVNNVAYIGWILESIPREIIDTHELQSITLDYRRECKHDDVVDSLTSIEPIEDAAIQESNGSAAHGSTTAANDGNECLNFLHLLRFSNIGLEISRSRTEWRKKPAKR